MNIDRFDSIGESIRDSLSNDYFIGPKYRMMVNRIKGATLLAEGNTYTTNTLLSKITYSTSSCGYCDVKQLSIDSSGRIVATIEIPKCNKNAVFFLNIQKQFNDLQFTEASIGARYVRKLLIADWCLDAVSKHYKASMAAIWRGTLLGIQLAGEGRHLQVNVGAAFSYKSTLFAVVGYDIAQSIELSCQYPYDKRTTIAGVYRLNHIGKRSAEFEVGVSSYLSDAVIVKGKISSKGILSTYFKNQVNNRLSFIGSVSMNCFHIDEGSKAGFGIEFAV